jgi:beta-glucosidase
MSLNKKDKIQLLDGKDVWHTKPVGDLPSLLMTDGPHGLRKQIDVEDHLGKSGSVKATAFPTASLTASSFDRKLIAEMAKAIAIEAKTHQVHMVLGPAMNIKRSPLCGRNFEYFSEDPYLTGELAAAYVAAMEKEGVGTSVKHFFCNNQEKNRFFVDSIVDERTLREIYLKAFERVVKEQPASVMASYNKINGFYGTESPIIHQILRKEWGYQGIVVSDWGAVSNRIASLKAGCDLEMPSSMGYHAQQIADEIEDDTELMKAVDTSAERIKRFVKHYVKEHTETFDEKKHHNLAAKVASESMILLKNETSVLPLAETEKVLLITGFDQKIRYQGGGSSHINPTQIDQFENIYHKYSAQLKMVKGFHINTKNSDQELIDEAILQAVKSDKVVIVIGLTDEMETEGFDRNHLNLPANQVELVKRIAQVHQKVTVVILGGSVVNLDFSDQVSGLLMAYLGGQGSARAIMDILYGKVNPSGRLAETFIDDITDANVKLTTDNHAVYYDEAIYVGYRYYQTFDKAVRYPFGFGLSYSDFEYSQIELKEEENHFIVSFNLKNNGPYPGKEVIQIYIENNVSSLYKAKRELKAFDKIYLDSGEQKHIDIRLEKTAFEVYDVQTQSFVVEKGLYKIQLAKHVDHIIESIEVELDGVELEFEQISYRMEDYNTSDFEKLYGKPLPSRHIKKKRPYTMNSTLEDLRNTWIGKMVANTILKEGKKQMSDIHEEWMKEVAEKTLLETPLRMLALFSDGKVSFHMLEGIIDLANLKVFRGLKKLRKENKGK